MVLMKDRSFLFERNAHHVYVKVGEYGVPANNIIDVNHLIVSLFFRSLPGSVQMKQYKFLVAWDT